ncbi:hypothetical protein EIP91_006755 [Steccherinum ochraceum]|uniref:Uncharacterized protein n=1 Tax=Steccherinum ochraceum TaxID=92696 RepID=A0A4R0R566_9APHY|nr:hypothetical protein EIP91_006755 [Steccherinum ochraceum]
MRPATPATKDDGQKISAPQLERKPQARTQSAPIVKSSPLRLPDRAVSYPVLPAVRSGGHTGDCLDPSSSDPEDQLIESIMVPDMLVCDEPEGLDDEDILVKESERNRRTLSASDIPADDKEESSVVRKITM